MLKGERGASAIAVTASLLLLIGMAAIAIDVGAGFNERRLDQATADVSVLAGALEYGLGQSAQSVVDEVKAYVDANVQPVTAAEWTACTDPGVLSLPTNTMAGVVGGSQCISFELSPDEARLRVRVPDRQTNTSFGRVLGMTNLITSAAAEATIFETSNGAFPAGVYANTGPGAEFCIKTGPNPKDSCDGPKTGDFGSFNPWFYTELDPGGISSLCTSGNQPAPLSRAMADGLDHRLGTTPVSPGTLVNGGTCPGQPGPLNPHQLDSGGGYSNADVTAGMVMGGSWDGIYSGRLARGPYVGEVDGSGTPGVINVFGVSLDNRPLWTYIDPSLADQPECSAAAGVPGTPTFPFTATDGMGFSRVLNDWDDAEQLMRDCLAAETDQLFSTDIDTAPRLATVPQYHQLAALPNNSCCYDILDFVPIFIQGLWTDEGPGWTCAGVFVSPGSYCRHDPGMVGNINHNSPGQRRIDSASALVLACEHLPPPTCQAISSGGSLQNQFYVTELTK
jgi:hypothetical protein